MTRPPMADASNSEGWIEWAGGECPVPSDTCIDAKLRDGEVLPYQQAGTFSPPVAQGVHATAANSNWHHDGSALDIVAYRIVGDDQ